MIGVFDSGLGGLSVLAAISRALPHSDLLYLADTAHVPYGEKSDAYIRERVLCIGQHLAGQGCQQIVVACNTATAAAVAALREALPDAAITTDIIVGFPGETDADFDAMMKLIDDIGAEQAHVIVLAEIARRELWCNGPIQFERPAQRG